MTDAAIPEPASGGTTAGQMLRAAREREGLHVAMLATAIKVSPAKLEALENDRYDELPNLTFARALAQSVCRSLKIDARPVLALLPQVRNVPLEGAMGSLKTPYHERSAPPAGSLAWASKPLAVAGGVLLLAALALALAPARTLERAWSTLTAGWPEPAASAPAAGASAPLPAASSASVPLSPPAEAASTPPTGASAALAADAAPTALGASAAAAPPTAPTASAAPGAQASAPAVSVAPAAATATASAEPIETPASASGATATLQLTATVAGWVGVTDGEGKTVFQRDVKAGETVTVDAPTPMKVKLGNAGAMSVKFRGADVDIKPHTRANVARLELR